MTDEAEIDGGEKRSDREPFWVRRRRTAEAAAVIDRDAALSGAKRLATTVDRTRTTRDRQD
jgi:hypothetical protein